MAETLARQWGPAPANEWPLTVFAEDGGTVGLSVKMPDAPLTTIMLTERQALRLMQDLLAAFGARALAKGNCYECGGPVTDDEYPPVNNGEQHGRSGWVHFRCMGPL